MSETAGPGHPLVVDPRSSLFLSLPAKVTEVHEAEEVGVTFPRGFVAAGVAAGIKESGRPDVGLSLIHI